MQHGGRKERLGFFKDPGGVLAVRRFGETQEAMVLCWFPTPGHTLTAGVRSLPWRHAPDPKSVQDMAPNGPGGQQTAAMGLHITRAMLHQEVCRRALELLSSHRAIVPGEQWLLMHALGAAC